MDNRWTIRGVEDDARACVEEVHELTGIPFGRLVSEAIVAWYQDLPEQDPMPPFRSAQLAQDYAG